MTEINGECVFNKDAIKTFEYRDLHGKTLSLCYVEEGEYGLLSGVDDRGVVYILAEVVA